MLYLEFMRKRGVRTSTLFVTPPISPNAFMALPMNSVYHYVDTDYEKFGDEDPLLQNLIGKTCVENVFGLDASATYGKTRRVAFNRNTANLSFFGANRELMRYESIKKTLNKQPRTLHVVNYHYMEDEVDYLSEPMEIYHRYLNKWQSVFANIARTMKEDTRMHYIRFSVPLAIPPRSLLTRAALNTPMIRGVWDDFATEDELFLVEFWKWFDQENEDNKSVFSLLSDSELKRFHVIFQVGGHWTMYNMGMVQSWIKSSKNKRGLWNIELIRRNFLGMLVNLSGLRVEPTIIPEEVEFVDQLNQVRAEDGEVIDPAISNPIIPAIPVKEAVQLGATKKQKVSIYKKPVEPSTLETSIVTADLSTDDEVFDTHDEEVNAAVEKKIDADIDQLEILHEKAKLEKVGLGEYKPYQSTNGKTLDHGVVDLASTLANKGLLSAAEVRRMTTLANRYKSNKAMDTGETIEKYIDIPPEELVIPVDVRITPKLSGVHDESMAFSSLNRFDKDYIEKTLHKDVHGALMCYQNAGVAVRDIKVVTSETLNDEVIIYSASLTPVIGRESTIRFTIPKVNPDGSYLAGGTKYRMRKQRGD